MAAAAEPAAAAPMPSAPAAYTVARGDTLAHIAGGVHGEVSLNRMMIALQRANPDAFIHQNINLLKSGSVLRIPAAEEAQTLSADEANLLVQQQVESWRQSSRPQLQPSAESAGIARPADTAQANAEPAPAAEAVKPATPHAAKPRHAAKAESAVARADKAVKPAIEPAVEPPAAKPAVARVTKAHLEIIPPAGGAARGSQTGASEGGSGSELRAQLAQTKEDLAARNAELGELKSRLADLEKMQADNQSLLSMKDSKLAEMQQRLAELEKNTSAAPAGANAAASAATATPTPTPSTEASASASTPAPVATAAPPTDVAPKPTPSPVAEQPPAAVETPWYQRTLVLIGGGLLLLGGVLGLLLRGRRAPAEAIRPSRYNTDALAASMASARAAGEEDIAVEDQDDDPGHESSGGAAHLHGNESVSAAVAAPDMPASPAASTPVRRPYWTGAYDTDSKPVDVEPPAAIPPVVAAPAPAAPMASPAVASIAPAESEDWGLDKPAASATAITAQHRAVPALDDPEQGVATKMELARAYIDIGDAEGARGMLEEVLMEGTDSQREDAFKLLETLD